MPQRATYKKAATVAYAHPMVARGFIVPLDKFAPGPDLSVRYVMPVGLKVNRAKAAREMIIGVKLWKTWPKNKSGRGPPTSPTLRPRVLTPRDHFAHRGGGRNRDYAQVKCEMQPKP